MPAGPGGSDRLIRPIGGIDARTAGLARLSGATQAHERKRINVSTPTGKTWFITGASRGFGREWTIAALERGDRVAATARDVHTLDDVVERFGDALLPIELDVTDRAGDFAAVE